jgi:hypothetical protein
MVKDASCVQLAQHVFWQWNKERVERCEVQRMSMRDCRHPIGEEAGAKDRACPLLMVETLSCKSVLYPPFKILNSDNTFLLDASIHQR